MKILQKTWAFVLAAFTVFAISCSPDYEDMLSTEEMLTRRGWEVEHFSGSSGNRTSEYSNLMLLFSTDGQFACRQDGESCIGNWQYREQGGTETLNLSITSPQTPVLEFNRQWEITGVSPSFLQLRMQNGAEWNELRLRALR